MHFEDLDINKLKKYSKEENIGCPFSQKYNGPIILIDKTVNIARCKKLCGIIFKKEYNELRCPCWDLEHKYVKKKFWEYIEGINS